MGDFLQALREYKAASAELVAFEVPELSRKIYVDPYLTARQMMRIEEARRVGLVATHVRTVCQLALDEEGKRLFRDDQEGDVEVLFPYDLLVRVSGEISERLKHVDLEVAKKKSGMILS